MPGSRLLRSDDAPAGVDRRQANAGGDGRSVHQPDEDATTGVAPEDVGFPVAVEVARAGDAPAGVGGWQADSASPTVAPDNDVYFGVLAGPSFLLRFSSDLTAGYSASSRTSSCPGEGQIIRHSRRGGCFSLFFRTHLRLQGIDGRMRWIAQKRPTAAIARETGTTTRRLYQDSRRKGRPIRTNAARITES